MEVVRQFNITYPVKWTKDGRDGTRWPIIGRAFEGKKGNITLQIDAIPLNFDGKLVLFEIEEDAEKGATRQTALPLRGALPPADEDVPF